MSDDASPASSPASSPLSSPISPIMEMLETTTTAICDSYFKCPAFSLHSHHRENTQTILYPLLLAATASYLSVSETSLSLESESHHTYSQNGPLVRHRGRLLGFIAGVELSALDRKNAKSNKQTKASSNPPTPPPSWRDSLNSLSSSFTAALNSPDPIKTLAQGNVAPAPPLQSPTPSATPPKRKTSLQQVKSLLTPSLKVYPQITPDDLKSRLEVYFLRLYGCNHNTANLLDGKMLKKIQSSVVKVAVKGVVKSFLATVSATTSPTLLLHSHIVAMCREALAVVEISREIETVVKYTIARIEADLDGNQTSTEDKSGGSSQGEGKELPSQIKSFLKSPKIADKFLRVENMFASKFDDAEVVSKCMSGHLKSLLEYLSEADNSTQLVMSSYGERMLSRGIDPSLRNEFKDGDFESEAALKSAYDKFHKQFKSIRLPPSDKFMCVNLVKHLSEEKEKAKGSAKYSEQSMMQALKDLKRERIFVNGREVVDRKVTSKRELVKVLTEAIEKGVVNPKPDKKATNNNLLDESLLASESDYSTGFSSAPDNDTSNKESGDSDCRRRRGDPNEKKVIARPRKFDTSKLTEIVSRILLASSRTGSGGDTLLFLNDLFGGDEVVLRPSSNENMQAAIEIDVYAGRVDIVCKAFYTVYLREDLEAPMLYLRGKMVERIPLFVQRVEGGELGDVELKEVESVEGEDEGYEFGRVLKINMAAPTIEAKTHENINTPDKNGK